MTPRRLLFGMGVLLVAVVLGVWLHRSDEERVRDAADAIVEAANRGPVELARALDEHAADHVSVTVSELPEPLVGRAAIVAAASRSAATGGELRFRMERVEISAEGGNARLNADFVTTLQLGLRGLRRARRGAALFQKVNGEFRLVSAEVGGDR